jgi:hypothetical protein
MSARDWGYAPGDSGYEYPDDDPEGFWISTQPVTEEDEDAPRQQCYLDGYGECVDFEQCRYYGCYHRGTWTFPRYDDREPEF